MKTTETIEYWVHSVTRGYVGGTENYGGDKTRAKARVAHLASIDTIREVVLLKKVISETVLTRKTRRVRDLKPFDLANPQIK